MDTVKVGSLVCVVLVLVLVAVFPGERRSDVVGVAGAYADTADDQLLRHDLLLVPPRAVSDMVIEQVCAAALEVDPKSGSTIGLMVQRRRIVTQVHDSVVLTMPLKPGEWNCSSSGDSVYVEEGQSWEIASLVASEVSRNLTVQVVWRTPSLWQRLMAWWSR